MIATIDEVGKLIIRAETPLESYALMKWSEDVPIPEQLIVNANWQQGPNECAKQLQAPAGGLRSASEHKLPPMPYEHTAP